MSTQLDKQTDGWVDGWEGITKMRKADKGRN